MKAVFPHKLQKKRLSMLTERCGKAPLLFKAGRNICAYKKARAFTDVDHSRYRERNKGAANTRIILSHWQTGAAAEQLCSSLEKRFGGHLCRIPESNFVDVVPYTAVQGKALLKLKNMNLDAAMALEILQAVTTLQDADVSFTFHASLRR